MMMPFCSSLFGYSSAVNVTPIITPFCAEQGSARNNNNNNNNILIRRRNKLITPHHHVATCAATLKINTSNSSSSLPQHHYNNDDIIGMKHESIVKEVKHELMGRARDEDNVVETLQMIDTIQRLGIEYHFEKEIQEALHNLHFTFTSHHHNYGLHQLALQFRLLRQAGYNVPSEVFNKLKDKKGKIKEKYSEDIMGVMELYEACQLRVEGEQWLDEAGDMAHHLLHAWASQHHNNPLIAEPISNTLNLPLHKSLPRFSTTSKYSNHFQCQVNNNKGWSTTLQELAQLDSLMLKSIYQKEILKVSEWWNEHGLGKELKSIKDVPLKCYMWPMACVTNPHFSEERIELSKPLSLVYIIDDIYDVCESLDTLTLFTDAVNRWELEATEQLQLPVHLKMCFKVLYDTTNQFAYKVYLRHGWNPISTLRKLWAGLCNAFLIEARWFASGHLPKAEVYLKNGITTTGALVALGHAFFLLDHGITNETAVLMDGSPGIISAVATIVRLSDDLEGAMEDNQDGHDGSYLKCYMKEYQGVSDEDTIKHVIHMISNSWKHVNQECLAPKPFSTSFKKVCLNAARIVPLMYNYGWKYQLSSVKEHMSCLFSA